MPTLRAKAARHSVAIMYGVMAVIVLVGFHRDDRLNNERCVDAQVNREALRENVRQVATLGRGLVSRNPDPAAKAAAVAQFDEYERTNLARLPEVEC